MKKSRFLIVLTALLCLVCALALTACEEEPEEPAPAPEVPVPEAPAPEEPAHTHAWGAWIETTAPTCTTQGVKTRICECGQSETQYVDIDSNAHVPASAWTTDGTHHWKICTRTGCTAQLSKTAHTSVAAWSSDATNHWKNCTVCGYDIALAAHTYDAENTCMCGDYKDKGVRFILSNGTYKVNYYTGAATEVVIPATYKGVAVTGIGNTAFSGCYRLTSVTIPASVTSIGNSAFSQCTGLTSVTIPAGVTGIGNSAFSQCTGLTSVTIPASVTSIGDYAFYGCSNLTTVTFGVNSQLTGIGSSVFSGCSQLTSVTIPASVTSIGEYAFYNCSNLTSVTFANPNGWWYAGSSAATSGTAIHAADLSNASTAATYLKSAYYYYYWKRT